MRHSIFKSTLLTDSKTRFNKDLTKNCRYKEKMRASQPLI